MLLACFANAKTTIIVNKLHKQTDLPYQVKESNMTDNISKVDELISLAKSKLGSSYEPTKAGPDNFDCSRFVYYLFTTNGISIPRTSIDQSESGKKLTRDELEKGDMLFFDTYERNHINHSGVYLGDGKFIHSSSGKAYGVIISDLDKGFYLDKFRWGIRKIENVAK
jgi:cell wall-associated NlpC family hydrolase